MVDALSRDSDSGQQVDCLYAGDGNLENGRLVVVGGWFVEEQQVEDQQWDGQWVVDAPSRGCMTSTWREDRSVDD